MAVLPCCHDLAVNDSGSLSGWLDRALAVDVMRAVRLEQRGYHVWTQTIPAAITPKNRLLLGEPLDSACHGQCIHSEGGLRRSTGFMRLPAYLNVEA